jgi:predicted DNA binding protein
MEIISVLAWWEICLPDFRSCGFKSLQSYVAGSRTGTYMPRVRIKLRFSGSVLDFSAKHPDVECRIQTAWPTGDDLYTIMAIETQDPAAVRLAFEEAPDIRAYEVLHADEQTLLIQYVLPSVPPPMRAVLDSGNLPPFPMIVRNGWLISEATTTRERLSQFERELENADITYEILSITHAADPTALLTDRQRQFIIEARKRGYYDTPRRCSLTDLAAVLEVSKPTASGILHRAEERIIKEFIDDPTL